METQNQHNPKTPRRLYKPDFPERNYYELRKSKISIGDPRDLNYRTTEMDAFPPRSRDVLPQTIDTKMLQKTHWTSGNCNEDNNISEYKASYVRHRNAEVLDAASTRNAMMKTTFTLSDGSGLNVPDKSMAVSKGLQKRENYQKFMTSTHFEIKSDIPSKWETTNQACFRPYTAQPPSPAQMNLRQGLGAKLAIEQSTEFGENQSLEHSTYTNLKSRDSRTPVNKRAHIEGNSIVFTQNKTNKWQRDNYYDNDGFQYYSTTSGDSLRKPQQCAIDPHYAQLRRIAFTHSSVADGNIYPTEMRTTSQDGLQPHPGFKPPSAVEKTAFVSHHDFKNWDHPEFTTTTQAAYTKKTAEKVESVNNRLQQSHAIFGSDRINENRTLYQDTFTAPPATLDRADMASIRAFHMGTHSNCKSGSGDHTGITTNQATYVHFKDVKPSSICEGLRGGHNIVQNEPRFTVRESSMHDDYQPIKNSRRPDPINNNLQRSHLQLKGDSGDWSTTQQDYFQFKTYRMPNDPF